MKKLIILFFFITFSSCDNNNSISEGNNKELFVQRDDYKKYLRNLLKDIDKGGLNNVDIFNKYYINPSSILEDSSILEYYLIDLSALRWMVKEYGVDSINIYVGDEMKETTYALFHEDYSKDKFCDKCGVIKPPYNDTDRVLICFKNHKIYSTLPAYDFEAMTVEWY